MRGIPIFRFFLLIVLFYSFPLASESRADPPQEIPPRPCDFYGTEDLPGTLNAGSVITARDSDGTPSGRFTVQENSRYGFLSCLADNPNTPEDEGAVDGDTITFYINGIRQQKQAIWKSGDVVRVDLGVSSEAGTFNQHLVEMPEYGNYQGYLHFSGVAVADMILDYLDSGNTDSQQDLMSYGDLNGDSVISSFELLRILSQKAPHGYHFSSTADLRSYSNRGLIDVFDSADQNDCIRQICHWLSYKVPGVAQGREYVPVGIATSSNPASSADSDYQHWMSVVGIRTNQDPFPNLTDDASFRDLYAVSGTLELFGVYLNDPGQSGLGFHTYMAADVWAQNYFRPIAGGLAGEGKYAAVMEPPDPDALPVEIRLSEQNSGLGVILKTPQKGISIFIPGWMDENVKEYLLGLFEKLKASSDFAALINDPYFGRSLEGATVNRCFKVDGGMNNDYAIIPFDKQIGGRRVTPAAVIVNIETGQFQIAYSDSKASAAIFTPMSLTASYKNLRKHIGWKKWVYPVNYWLSNNAGSALYPGWSTTTASYQREGWVQIVKTATYTVTPKEEFSQAISSPEVEVLDNQAYNTGNEWIKTALISVSDSGEYTVSMDAERQCKETALLDNGDRWLVILKGPEEAYCRIKIQNSQGGVTYVDLGR